MKRLTALVAVAAALALPACAHDTLNDPPLTKLPRELSVAERQLVTAENSFAFNLLHATVAADPAAENVFISPLSVSVALGMTLNGAAGTTADQMKGMLGFTGLSQHDINQGYQGLIDLLAGLDDRVSWNLANSIWYRQDYAFRAEFLDTTRAYFSALVSPLDFSSSSAGPTINQWVSNQTAGRIPSIVPDRLPGDANMFLINAIYFKGTWTTQFDAAHTQPATFYRPQGNVTVPMMRATEMPVRLLWRPDLQVLELPYARGAFVMTIVVPPLGTVDSLARALTPENWVAWTDSLSSEDVSVQLPKFTVRYATGLNAALKSLGMTDAFAEGLANFTGMDSSGRTYVDTVVHKTFVLVDEAGTEAAAATEVGMKPTGAPLPVIIDRPFLFAIRERFSGTIIFLGVIRNPAAPS